MRQNRGFELHLPLTTIMELLAVVAIFFIMFYMFRAIFGASSIGG